jgi:hypothetical protein
MKKKFYFRFLFVAILILINCKANAQGVGNHITMSLENCAQTSGNTMEFDLMIMSDGDSVSDLRINSVSFGINFNTGILPSGATMGVGGVSGTTHPIFLSPVLNFPASSSPDHIRITQLPYSGGVTGPTMPIGQKYRASRIRLTSSANWILNSNPNFSLQDSAAAGHTDCAAITWIDSASNTSAFSITGTGNGQRSVNVGCSLSLNCASCPPVANFASSDTAFCTATGQCIDFFDHSSGNPTSWQWFFPGATPDTSTSQNPTNICYYNPGTYPVTLIVSNVNGSDTLAVSPMITFNTGPAPPTISVAGGDTLVSSSAAFYQWYFNGMPITGATDSFYVATQAGTYAVQITTTTGCSALSNGILIGGCLITVSAQVTNATCATCANGSAVALVQNGTPPYTITWYTSPIRSGNSVDSVLPGTYTICARDANNCTTCSSFTIDSMNCTGYSISTSDSNATCITCSDGRASVTATGGTPPYNYLWSNGYTVASANTFSHGTYTVSVTDAIGCLQTRTVTVGVGYCRANYNLFADTIPHTYTLVNTAIGASPISYLWSWGDGSTDTAAYPMHTYASAGFYTICLNITDFVGCTSAYCDSFTLLRPDNNSMISITVVPSLITGVIDEGNFYQTLKLFPNPTNGSVAISYSLPKSSDVVVEVYNSYGQLVKEITNEKQTAGRQETVFDAQKLAAGIYFVKVSVDGNVTVLKLVKL